MDIQSGMLHGRKGWKLNNDALSLFLMAGGGHIASVTLKDRAKINPFWIPDSRSCILGKTMFDTITAEITTAADKLAHLRRFL